MLYFADNQPVACEQAKAVRAFMAKNNELLIVKSDF